MSPKTHITSLIAGLALCSTAAAQTFTSDFTANNGDFSGLDNTNITVSNGDLSFVSSNAQGSGVAINALNALNLSGSSNTVVADALFFDFSVVVPAENNQNNDELGIFFGPVFNQAQSGSIQSGQNANGFTLFIDEGNLVGISNVNNQRQESIILSGLTAGEQLDIQVDFSVGPAQNSNQRNTFATVTAETATQTSNSFDLNGAVNRNINDVNGFQFAVISTRGNSSTLTDFTVSTSPIIDTPSTPPVVTVPEPSSSLLLLGSFALLLGRRQRN